MIHSHETGAGDQGYMPVKSKNFAESRGANTGVSTQKHHQNYPILNNFIDYSFSEAIFSMQSSSQACLQFMNAVH